MVNSKVILVGLVLVILGVILLMAPVVSAVGEPKLTILSPAGALTSSPVVRSSFVVSFTVSNFSFTSPGAVGITNAPNQGHMHVYLDGAYYALQSDVSSISFSDLSPGNHTIKLQLVNNDHSTFSPDVSQTITVDVVPTEPLSVTGIDNLLNWVMINTVGIALALILIIIILVRKK